MSDPLHGLSLVEGSPVAAAGASFHALDPTTGSEIEPAFRHAQPSDLERACRAADRAWKAGASAAARAALLESIAGRLETLDSLVERVMLETALPEARVQMERGRTCAQLRAFATALNSGTLIESTEEPSDPDRTPLPKPSLVRRLEPIGPVAVFGASNFPLAFSIAGGDTASALAAGCPVIAKSHPAHPGTSELVAGAIVSAIQESGLDPGWFSVLHLDEAHAQALVQHPLVRGVGFTGSAKVGRALFDVGSSRPQPIPVFAEMGSVNPVLILPDALEDDRWVGAYAGSLTLGVGQFCTNPGLILGWGSAFDEFLDKVASELGSMSPGTFLTPGIARAYDAGVRRLDVHDDTRKLSGGGPGAPALLVAGSVSVRADRELTEEVFGPCALAVRCTDLEDALATVETLGGQLTATVLTANPSTTGPVLRVLARVAGRVVVNRMPTGVEVSAAMQHGGPSPASTDARFTSVGLRAVDRWLRPVCYQGVAELESL